MSKHSSLSQHNGIDQQASPSLSAPDPLGAGLFGEADGASSFVPPVALLWPSGLSALSLPMSELSAGVSATVSTPGSGLVFDNTYLSGCTAQFETCIVAAEKQLESLFTNTDTITASFNEVNLGNNNDALTNTAGLDYLYSYATLKAALLKAAPGDVLPSTDPSNGGTWSIPESYARMLGLTTATESEDDNVQLNTYYPKAFGQDVINGLTHELSEGAMGRIGSLGDKGVWDTMDLFRYNSAGQPDYTDGRDGDTAYFSPNGGLSISGENLPNKGAPTLTYNNEYNSAGNYVSPGDNADWTQLNVFGATANGETLALTQTELEVMEALGWHLSLKQDVDSTSGGWETPTDWSTGSMPIEPQDVYIDGAEVTLDSNVLVNSIATSSGGTLVIGDTTATTLIAVDGTNLNSEDASSVASGNLGTVIIEAGSALQIGYINETFNNAGSLVVGKGAGGGTGGGTGVLDIACAVNLTGGGTLTLGAPADTGDILDAPGVGADALVNVNNTIQGTGLIDIDTFDNQAGGHVEATGFLQIISPSFSNEGFLIVEANQTLDLGQVGTTQSLANSGTVNIDAGADLEISGNYTVSGSGGIAFKGAGAEITSDGDFATFTNAGTIDGDYAGLIGDNVLTFDNSGIVAAGVDGVTLTVYTGFNTVTNTGTLAAENLGILDVISNIANQGTMQAGSSASAGTLDVGFDNFEGSLANTGVVLIYAGSGLEIGGDYTVSGSGAIEIEGAGGDIASDGTSASLTNASNIAAYASGQIGDGNLSFDNQDFVAAEAQGAVLTINTGANTVVNTGTLEAEYGATLAIASSLSNAGTVNAGTSPLGADGGSIGSLDLGADGTTESSYNTGAINLYQGGDLAIAGNYTIAGTGTLAIKGAGADITSDGKAPATFTNASTITVGLSTAQIGDVGIEAANDLTFVNTGTVLVGDATLTINTGAHTVNDSGLLEAANGATLAIDSSLTTSSTGSLDAESGSVLDLAGGGSLAGAISGAGTVIIGGATTLKAGASLSAANVVETANLTLASVSFTNTAADNFTMTAASGALITLGSTGTGSFTNDGTLLANGAGTERITAPLIDSGTIAVNASTLTATGMLEITGKLSGTGSLYIGPSATAYLTAGGSLSETVSGSGTLELGGAYTLAGGNVAAGTVEVNATHSLSGTGTLAFAVIDRGSVAASGGQLTIDGGISGNGTLAAGAGAYLDVVGGGSFAGVIASTGTGEVFLAGATTLTSGAKLAGHVIDSANLKLAGVAVTNAAGNIFSLQGAETLSSSGAGAFINDGEFVHSFGQTATVSAPFTNSGIVSAQSGTLSFLGSVAGTGTMDLGIAGTIALGLGATNQLVDFESLGGGLELAHPLDFAGSITGFASHDSIFLENTSFTGFSFNNDLLTVKHGTTTVANLNIVETSNQFTLTAENHGVLITFG